MARQLETAASWRIGVDAPERFDLVVTGAFAQKRNPIFAAMFLTGVALASMTPSVVASAGVARLVVSLPLQVRVVEESYLWLTLGTAYVDHAARTGRFLYRPPADAGDRGDGEWGTK